jgi:putative two-component system response regulator
MKILIADDNRFFRLDLKRTLEEWGYQVVECEDGKHALELLSGPSAPKVAILDWIMPGLSGPELCRRVRSMQQPEPPYLIILSCLGRENMIPALEAGADDYIHKPYDRKELHARLATGKRIVKLQTSQTMVYTLARASEAKSPYTKGHSDRVTHYALALARRNKLSDADQDLLRRGGLLHDIGKIGIPDKILDKPGPLTTEEYDIIKQHPMLGVEILEPLQSLDDILPLVRWHHERCDGKGYPDGLEKKDIPYLVRLLSVADVYDALVSKRPYRPALEHFKCLEIMIKNAAEGGLDPDLVAQFLELPREVFGHVNSGENLTHFNLNLDALPLRRSMADIQI